MATRPTLTRAIAKTKNTAKAYNDNFDAMMDFVDDSIAEAKTYVDGFMPTVTGQAGKFLTNNGTTASWAVAVPAGTIFYYGYTSAPTGWLVCDGSAISRTTYAELYGAIGTTFGEGDGETTFNLPDLMDVFIEGSSTVGTEKTAGLPNITGGVTLTGVEGVSASGALYSNGSSYGRNGGHENYNFTNKMGLDASRSSSIYGNSTTVQPPALTMLPIIKY